MHEQEVMERWNEYFLDILNGKAMTGSDSNSVYQHVQSLEEPLSKEEIKYALKTLKNNNAPGGDGITAKC